MAFVLCLPSPWELVVRATEVSSAMGMRWPGKVLGH